jgi:hygromycin-B 4-O-kinase
VETGLVSSPSLEIGRVTAFLAERFADVRDVAPIGKGEWSSAFAFTCAEGERVARFGRYPEDYAKDRRAAGFARPGLPVPVVLEIDEAFGGVYAISERAHGTGFDALETAGYRRVLPALFETIEALRTVETGPGYGIWGTDGAAPARSWRATLLDVDRDDGAARTGGWRDKLRARPDAAARFDTALRTLRESVEVCPETPNVIHADLMGDNLLVQDDRIAAVVDWGCSMYGDFVYDLARLTFWVPWFPELQPVGLLEWVRERWGAEPDFDARLRCCWLHLGLDAQAYNALTDRWDELERSGRRTLELAG